MTATFTWSVVSMECRSQEGGNTDVVFSIRWACKGAQSSQTALIDGTTEVPSPTGSFTPYADLTQDQVLSWVWADGVDKAEIEAQVQEQIDLQINPVVVSPPLPWPTPVR